MQAVCRLAAQRGVRVGAQVSYKDRAGFGRRFVDVSADELQADLLYQLGALAAVAGASGVKIAYVKPHGALYNAVVTHELHAAAVVAAVTEFDPTLPLLGLPGARVLEVARAAGLQTVIRGLRRPDLHGSRHPCAAQRAGRGPRRSRGGGGAGATHRLHRTGRGRRRHGGRCLPLRRCACTVTPQAPWTSPAECGWHSKRPASQSHPSREHPAVRRGRDPRRPA